MSTTTTEIINHYAEKEELICKEELKEEAKLKAEELLITIDKDFLKLMLEDEKISTFVLYQLKNIYSKGIPSNEIYN
tara:strand:+ start:5597 stop:5827 length:231 start_codon:yes stop_codon:yes gene_type:complete